MRFITFDGKFILAVVIIITVGISIIESSRQVLSEIREFDAVMSSRISLQRLEKPDPIIAKGLYLTAASAARKAKREEIIDLINRTELNAVVIDIKDFSGSVLYDSKIALVDSLKTDRDVLKNIHSVLADFKRNGIYVIARQTVFQDPALVQAKPEWAIKTADGALWRDYKGLSWVDPTNREVWNYNMVIAREAAQLGFDEINFDYVRFPSDGDISTARYGNLVGSKAETMAAFYAYVHTQLRNRPVYTSLDLFGLVLELHNFDLNIGQTLKSAVNTVDYIYPMTYPSHYPKGHLSFINPADRPYEVIKNGLARAQPILAGSSTKLRPWLQAFNLGAIYDAKKIRDEIQAAEEASSTAGWMIWNASNEYTDQGLLPQA
ncbi:MAG: GTP-binding protein [Parcubacteria group bacterium]|nr:GTP-binding protein [Parcubacteria group bacterium]